MPVRSAMTLRRRGLNSDGISNAAFVRCPQQAHVTE